MLLEEFRTAHDLLCVAIDRYMNACLSIRGSLTGDRSQLEGPIGSILTNKLPALEDCEKKLHDSKIVIHQSINMCSDVVPLGRIPVEALVYIFRLVVDMQHRSTPHLWKGIPTYPLKLAHVCTSWRHIVHCSPSLWSRIIIYPYSGANQQLKNYMDLYSSHAKDVPMEVSIFNTYNRHGPRVYRSSDFTIPTSLTGRIGSIETRLFIPRGSPTTKTDGERLLAKLLQRSNNMLKRFVLNMSFQSPHSNRPNNESDDSNRHTLKIDLPDDQLEDTLSPITDLWLRGAYFKWESKAYHGLVSLRLERVAPRSIPEVELVNILRSSPRLRFVDIDLFITRTVDPPDLLPIHLPDLELIVGNTSLLRLIRPGSNELTVTILDSNYELLVDASVSEFFSCANIVIFCSMNSLPTTSAICYLLSFAPRLRGLAISHTKLNGTLPDVTPHALDTLYLLNGCVIERALLQEMVERWGIKRIVFQHSSYDIHDKERTPYHQLKDQLSDLSVRSIQLEFAPEAPDWGPPMDLFLGPLT